MDWENSPYLLRKQFYSVLNVLRYLLLLPIGVIYLFLIYYQIFRGEYYYEISEKNRLRIFSINAPRGIIYDVNNNVIADNRPSITVFYYPLQRVNAEEVNNLLSILPFARDKIFNALKTKKVVSLGSDLDRQTIFHLFLTKHRIGNVFVSTEFKRRYPENGLFSHLIGYVGEITYSEYLSLRTKGYGYTDIVGRSGIEKVYEEYLKGVNGALFMEVDAKGNPTRILRTVPPKVGKNLYLTIDKDLQKVARDAIAKTGKNGAVVGIDPRDGAIRILVSYKDFNPNLFVVPTEEKKILLKDKSLPLLNRALQGIYPPGSTFKVLTMIAALNEKKFPSKTTVLCQGSFKFGDKIFKCWEKKGHGYVDMFNGLRVSCNVYFINLGLRIGIDEIEKYAKMFYFGEKTGIDLPYEVAGIVPSRNWKKNKFKEEWYEGDTVSVSIGQGYIVVTPIQLAVFVSAVANRGIFYTPYIVSRVEDVDGEILYTHTPNKKDLTKINSEVWDFVINSMKAVVSSGTGRAAYIPEFPAAGKTGTSQNPQGEDHAWFICFAPAEEDKQAEIALAVIVEHGGKGGSVAAPIAREVLIEYYKKTRMKQITPQTVHSEVEYGD
ncbi:MAG: penicillin-binding protein 2 [Endomicrobia bacterium]|nr:penicillin-binding protein 2 [Endomicrobiia bacterium]